MLCLFKMAMGRFVEFRCANLGRNANGIHLTFPWFVMFILLAWLAGYLTIKVSPVPSIKCGSPTAVLGTEQLPGHGTVFLWKWMFPTSQIALKIYQTWHLTHDLYFYFFLLHLHSNIRQMIHNNIDAFGPVLSVCCVWGDNKAVDGVDSVGTCILPPSHTATP